MWPGVDATHYQLVPVVRLSVVRIALAVRWQPLLLVKLSIKLVEIVD